VRVEVSGVGEQGAGDAPALLFLAEGFEHASLAGLMREPVCAAAEDQQLEAGGGIDVRAAISVVVPDGHHGPGIQPGQQPRSKPVLEGRAAVVGHPGHGQLLCSVAGVERVEGHGAAPRQQQLEPVVPVPVPDQREAFELPRAPRQRERRVDRLPAQDAAILCDDADLLGRDPDELGAGGHSQLGDVHRDDLPRYLDRGEWRCCVTRQPAHESTLPRGTPLQGEDPEAFPPGLVSDRKAIDAATRNGPLGQHKRAPDLLREQRRGPEQHRQEQGPAARQGPDSTERSGAPHPGGPTLAQEAHIPPPVCR
jgi:hypothetical protein